MYRINKLHALMITISLLFLTSCQQQEVRQEQRLRNVKYQAVKAGKNASSRIFPGLAKASTDADLSFRIPGTLISLPVKIGNHVKRGQTIAKLDPSQFQLQAQQAQATLAQATANWRNARAAYERVKGLYENNNASRHDLDAARALADSSLAQVNAAKKAWELALLNISYTHLKAKTDCYIAAVYVSSNEFVSSGQNIVNVVCGSSLDVEVAAPGIYIAAIRYAMPVTITFSIFPGKIFTAKVTEVGVATISGGTTFPVTVTLDKQQPGLRPGLDAEVTFHFPENPSNIITIIPAFAVTEDEKGRFVYLVKPGETSATGIIKRQTVTVGELRDTGLEITDGLAFGDKVVTAGVSVIRDGLQVKLNQ